MASRRSHTEDIAALAERAAVLLLAAGSSTRFGGEKLLAPIDGLPMVGHVLRLVEGFPFKEKIAVVRADLPVLDVWCREAGFQTVRNGDPAAGMSRSLAMGVAAASEADAVLVLLADMPFVSKRHIEQLMVQYDAAIGVIASSRHGVRAPPAILGRAMFAKVLALSGDRGARDLIAEAPVVEGAPDMLRDIDTPSAICRAT